MLSLFAPPVFKKPQNDWGEKKGGFPKTFTPQPPLGVFGGKGVHLFPLHWKNLGKSLGLKKRVVNFGFPLPNVEKGRDILVFFFPWQIFKKNKMFLPSASTPFCPGEMAVSRVFVHALFGFFKKFGAFGKYIHAYKKFGGAVFIVFLNPKKIFLVFASFFWEKFKIGRV